jgi:uncharacterized protein (DUF4415 family)
MQNDSSIKRYSRTEIEEMLARGEGQTDYARLAAMTDEEIERNGEEDLREHGEPLDWYVGAVAVRPEPKKLISLRLDPDVVEWFRQQGPGYQTRINAVLRSYMDHKNTQEK